MGRGPTRHGTPAQPPYPHEAPNGVTPLWGAGGRGGGHQQGARACLAPWWWPSGLCSPLHPGMAARLSSAPGNAPGFLGAMPERGEARGNAVAPGEVLLPGTFSVGKGSPLSKGLCPTWGRGLLPPLLRLLLEGGPGMLGWC